MANNVELLVHYLYHIFERMFNQVGKKLSFYSCEISLVNYVFECASIVDCLAKPLFAHFYHQICIVSFVCLFYSLQIKTKMQIQIMRSKSGAAIQYRNVFHAGWVIISRHGVRGCYQGLGATILRDTPAFGIYFGNLSTYILRLL